MSRLKVAAAAGIVICAASGSGTGAAAVHKATGAITHARARTATSRQARSEAAANANVATGQSLAARYGWDPGTSATQWGCLYTLWMHESGWQMVWNTAGSGAYGIPQSLPASKMTAAGADYLTNPATQIRWGLSYIRSTYGTPCAAWSFWQAQSPNHWY
jgi:hypothetical protein